MRGWKERSGDGRAWCLAPLFGEAGKEEIEGEGAASEREGGAGGNDRTRRGSARRWRSGLSWRRWWEREGGGIDRDGGALGLGGWATGGLGQMGRRRLRDRAGWIQRKKREKKISLFPPFHYREEKQERKKREKRRW